MHAVVGRAGELRRLVEAHGYEGSIFIGCSMLISDSEDEHINVVSIRMKIELVRDRCQVRLGSVSPYPVYLFYRDGVICIRVGSKYPDSYRITTAQKNAGVWGYEDIRILIGRTKRSGRKLHPISFIRKRSRISLTILQSQITAI